jgi:hypothetical protein
MDLGATDSRGQERPGLGESRWLQSRGSAARCRAPSADAAERSFQYQHPPRPNASITAARDPNITFQVLSPLLGFLAYDKTARL